MQEAKPSCAHSRTRKSSECSRVSTLSAKALSDQCGCKLRKQSAFTSISTFSTFVLHVTFRKYTFRKYTFRKYPCTSTALQPTQRYCASNTYVGKSQHSIPHTLCERAGQLSICYSSCQPRKLPLMSFSLGSLYTCLISRAPLSGYFTL